MSARRPSEAVIDTTLLSRLHRANLDALLPLFFERVHVPTEVIQEARRSPEALRTVALIDGMTTFRECNERDQLVEHHISADVQSGEAAVLVQTMFHHNRGVAVVALIDDAKGHAYALDFHVPVWRTGRLLVELKRTFLIDEVAPYLDRLSAAGFRLTPAVRAAILKNADEA